MSQIDEVIYFDAVLTPNRSLSPRGFAVLMTVVGVASFACGVAFLSMGAFPVVGFFGLDALAVYIAFRSSFRRQRERIEHGRTAYVIGRFLTCPERKSLSIAIRAALQNARAERHPA